MRRCDADMADAPGRPVIGERFQMAFPVDQIVDLHEIEFFDAPEGPRFRHLIFPVGDQRGPDLGRTEQGPPFADFIEAVSDDILGRSVHW